MGDQFGEMFWFLFEGGGSEELIYFSEIETRLFDLEGLFFEEVIEFLEIPISLGFGVIEKDILFFLGLGIEVYDRNRQFIIAVADQRIQDFHSPVPTNDITGLFIPGNGGDQTTFLDVLFKLLASFFGDGTRIIRGVEDLRSVNRLTGELDEILDLVLFSWLSGLGFFGTRVVGNRRIQRRGTSG